MMKLIVNGDDYGYCESVNQGIIDAHKNGIVTSTTIMAGMGGFDHGVKLLKETKTLPAGVHMTLSCGRPLLTGHKTIVDENGNFFKRLTPDVLAKFDTQEIYDEFVAQIEKVKNAGIEITHLDSHHHIHGALALKEVVEKICSKYKLPMRNVFVYDNDLDVPTVVGVNNFYQQKVEEIFFLENENVFRENGISDMMCHPAYPSEFLSSSSSYADGRTKEFEVLTSQKVKDDLNKLGVVLTNYRDL